MKPIRLFFILPFILIASVTFAQHGPTAPADKAYASGDYYDAITLYKKAFTKEKDKKKKGDILFMIAESYRHVNDYKNQAQWYAKAIKAGNKEPKAPLHLADALKFLGKYDEAIAKYNDYKKVAPNDPLGDLGVQSCQQAQKWKDHPVRFKVENVTALNSKYSDFGATYSNKDKRHVIFTSSRAEATGKNNDGGTGEKFQDLFEVSVDKKGKWASPRPLTEPVNTPSNEGSAAVNAKGDELYFTRCENEKGKIGLCEVYFSKRNGQAWDMPKLVNLAPDSTVVAQPTLSPDGKTLYFVSNMDGGQGGYDIWMSTWDESAKKWGIPENLGNKVNTPEDEMFPFAAPDGYLYFSSKGHIGMGGFDIFKSKMDNGIFEEPVNLKYPANSSADDFAFVMMDETGSKGFLSSNRDGGRGSDDIYQWTLPPLVFTVSGRVYDTDSKANIQGAHIELFASDGSNIPVTTDKTGAYKYDLKVETDYKVVAAAPTYLSKQFELSTKGMEQSKDFTGDFDFAMKSMLRAIELPNILYDLGKWDLRPESKTVLEGLIKIMNDNPTLVIELGSHTDSRPIPMSNDTLSQRRAQSVVNYLIEKGLAPQRLVAQGYGQHQPRVLDKDMGSFKTGDSLSDDFISKQKTTALKEEAHQLNRRTEFRVLRTDYIKEGSAPPEVKAEEPAKPAIDKAPVKAAEPKGPGEVYTAIQKDTYTSIAKQFGIDVKTLKSINGIKAEQIFPGMELKVDPEGDYSDYDKKLYTLDKDDKSWKDIAKKTGKNASDLKKMNKSIDEKDFRAGKKIHIEK